MDSASAEVVDTSGACIPSLVVLCQRNLFAILRQLKFSARAINHLCKHVPEFLLEPILEEMLLLDERVITETALLAFLVPARRKLHLLNYPTLRNSTLKQIGFHCPNMLCLNMSGCSQVSNAVIRSILQGCPHLEELRVDQCLRITDAAFDAMQSPFHSLLGCASLKVISLQGCPQITGHIVSFLNKMCRQLQVLNLAQCKQIENPSIKHVFEHRQLKSLNLRFVNTLDDSVFSHLVHNLDLVEGVSAGSPLERLDVGSSQITDSSMGRLCSLTRLIDIKMPWCQLITDVGIDRLASSCPLLQSVDIKSCQITDVALAAVVTKCRFLKNLDVSWCNSISDSGLQSLVVSGRGCRGGRKALEKLSVVWCTLLTDVGVSALLASELASLRFLDLTGCNAVSTGCVQQLRQERVAMTVVAD
jgi:anti-anti-sigma regulatory factor